jgi:hypothetical protein
LHVAWLAALLLAAPIDEGVVVERVLDTQVDWSARTLTADGTARAGDRVATAAAARLWRQAEADARGAAEQRARAAFAALRAYGTETLGQLARNDAAVAAALARTVQSFHPASTRYHDDGRVDVSLVGVLGGEVLLALEPAVAPPAADVMPGDEGTTGVVVSARGIAAVPALAPRLYDEDGTLLYGASLVRVDASLRQGVAAYFKSLDRAVGDARVGGKPLIVKALRATSPQSADLVVARSDAARLRRLGAVLAEGRVAVVVD